VSAIVQAAVNRVSGGSVTATFGSPVTNGNSVILVAYVASASGVNFTTWADNGGSNTYLSDVTYAPSNDPTTKVEVRSVASSAGGPTTFTVSNDSFRDTMVAAYEVSGLATSSAFEQAVNAAYAASSGSTTITTTNANDFIAGLFIHTGDTDTTHTAGSLWTKDGPTDPAPASIESRIGVTATTYTVDMTFGAAETGNVFVVAYKGASVASGIPIYWIRA